MSTLAYGLNYLSTSWSDLGRPTLTLILSNAMLGELSTRNFFNVLFNQRISL